MRRKGSSASLSISGSAVDLLSCGLAAAAVLWILVLPNSGETGTGDVDRVNGMIRLSQFGNPHIHDIPGDDIPNMTVTMEGSDHSYETLANSKFRKLLPIAASSDSNSDEIEKDDAKVILKVGEKKSEGFAAETAIIFKNVKPGTKVVLKVRACLQRDQPHAIKLLSGDRSGVNTQIVFWQNDDILENALKTTHSPPSGNNWFPNFADILKSSEKYFLRTSSATQMYSTEGGGNQLLTLEITATDSGLIQTKFITPNDSSSSRSFSPSANWITKSTQLRAWCSKHNSSGGSC